MNDQKVRAIRGAISVEADTKEEIHRAVQELLPAMMHANDLAFPDLISVFLTSTPDLTADFPAVGARAIGFESVPLMCACEIDVPGAMRMIIRVMIHAYSSKAPSQVEHIYLKRALSLRKDLIQ